MDAVDEILLQQLISEKEACLKAEGAKSSPIEDLPRDVTSKECITVDGEKLRCLLTQELLENTERKEILTGGSNDNCDQDAISSAAQRALEENIDSAPVQMRSFDFLKDPTFIGNAEKEFGPTRIVKNNFLKGCKWSPDGACLLTASEDRVLRLFDVYNFVQRLTISNLEDVGLMQDMSASLRMQAPDLIYDYCWYPFMNSNDPSTCCFLSTSRESPIHLYDAFNGSLRCSYRAFNHVDEFVAANSVAFNSDGSKIVCGYDKCIRIFDLSIPGRTCSSHSTFTKKTRRGLKGIISCFDFHPVEPDLFACGSYGRSIGLFSLKSGNFQFRLDGQSGGVTSVKFTPCGTRLIAAGRKDDEILCFDLRNLGQVLFVLRRPMTTNQRIQFDVCPEGRFLMSGDTDGNVHVWDLQKFEENCFEEDGSLTSIRRFKAHDQAVSGSSLHPFLPLLATTSGQRCFMEPISRDDDVDDSSGDDSEEDKTESDSALGNSPLKLSGKGPVWLSAKPSQLDNSLRFWHF